MGKEIYIHREIERPLKLLHKQFPAVALTGPRQSGKSTLLKKIFGKNYQFISFDEPLMRQRAVSDPELFLDNIKEPVIFDEIQYVPELLSYLKILIDKERNKRGRFILTGSQQFNLIKNLGDTLAGRIGLLTLLPFSKHEKEVSMSLDLENTNIGYRLGRLFAVLEKVQEEAEARKPLQLVGVFHLRAELQVDFL